MEIRQISKVHLLAIFPSDSSEFFHLISNPLKQSLLSGGLDGNFTNELAELKSGYSLIWGEVQN